MLKLIISIIILFFTFNGFAKNSPDFHALEKIWGDFDSVKISKSGQGKNTVELIKGKISTTRNLYMISPENPEMMLWFFHGLNPDGNNQTPEIIIKEMGLKGLSSWYNAAIVIVDSGASMYLYNPDSGLSEIQIYSGIYDKLTKLYGLQPTIIVGISSGAEGAVKFAPFVKKLTSLICISGIYNYDSLPVKSDEYKIRIKEYGSADDWEFEQPVRILPSVKCGIILISEDNSAYSRQAEAAAAIPGIKNIKHIKVPGKSNVHNRDFWRSEEVKKILKREIQAAGGSF